LGDLDRRLERWSVLHRTEPLDSFFVFLSYIGSFGAIWLAIAAVVAFYYRRPTALPLTFIAVLLGDGITGGLKFTFDRVRPSDRFDDPEPLLRIAHTPSFPSGHAATSFACAGTLAPYVTRRIAVALYVLAGLISWSRVYVGAHYPLDILVGAALGLAIARALRLLPAVLRRLLPPPRRG
jgi:undecaprenyl-diphosphatase